jgi:hypothetical protein
MDGTGIFCGFIANAINPERKAGIWKAEIPNLTTLRVSDSFPPDSGGKPL